MERKVELYNRYNLHGKEAKFYTECIKIEQEVSKGIRTYSINPSSINKKLGY